MPGEMAWLLLAGLLRAELLLAGQGESVCRPHLYR